MVDGMLTEAADLSQVRCAFQESARASPGGPQACYWMLPAECSACNIDQHCANSDLDAHDVMGILAAEIRQADWVTGSHPARRGSSSNLSSKVAMLAMQDKRPCFAAMSASAYKENT